MSSTSTPELASGRRQVARDEHVGGLDELVEHLATLVGGEVEGDGALAPVVVLERRVRPARLQRPAREQPHRVGPRRALDLDDIRAPLREHAARHRHEREHRRVDDPDPLEDVHLTPTFHWSARARNARQGTLSWAWRDPQDGRDRAVDQRSATRRPVWRNSRPRSGQVEVVLPDEHPARDQADELLDDDHPRGRAATGRGRTPCRGTATRTAPCWRTRPTGSSPQNTPIGTHSSRRRRSRGRPIVTSIASASSTTAKSSVCPYGAVAEREVDQERQHRAERDRAGSRSRCCGRPSRRGRPTAPRTRAARPRSRVPRPRVSRWCRRGPARRSPARRRRCCTRAARGRARRSRSRRAVAGPARGAA